MARSVKIHFADGSHVPGCPTNQPTNQPTPRLKCSAPCSSRSEDENEGMLLLRRRIVKAISAVGEDFKGGLW